MTPEGKRIDWREPIDSATGGSLEEDNDPESVIVHVESVVFKTDQIDTSGLPMSRKRRARQGGKERRDRNLQTGSTTTVPIGDYMFGAALWDRRGDTRDSWTLTVSVDGNEVDRRTGTGTSDPFPFQFQPTADDDPINRQCSTSVFDFSDPNVCPTNCRPFKHREWCPANESFLDRVHARRETYSTDPGGIFAAGQWYHIIEAKLAAKIFADEEGFSSPDLYYCSDDIGDIDTWSPPTGVSGFVVKATGLHSDQGVFVLPSGFNGPEILTGSASMSRQDVKDGLTSAGTMRYVIEQYVPGDAPNSIPPELKIHMFNGVVGSIVYMEGRGTSCACFAELDENWERIDTNGCFRSAHDAAVDDQGCTRIGFTTKRIEQVKGLDMCVGSPTRPTNLDDILDLARNISIRIGVYTRVDLFIPGNGGNTGDTGNNNDAVLVGEFTPGHTNGRVHCSSKSDGSCIDPCFLGRLWDGNGGDSLHGGTATTIPNGLSGWDDAAWKTRCDQFLQPLQ